MSDNKPKDISEILGQQSEPVTDAPQDAVQQEAAPNADASEKQPRDPGGKFAPKQAKTTDESGAGVPGEKEPAAPPAAGKSQAPEGYVPLAALVDTRFKANQRELENEALRRQLAELQQRNAPPPVDFIAEPEAFMRQSIAPLEQRLDDTVTTLTLRASRAEAVGTHGPEAVSEMEQALATAWQNGDPEIEHLRTQMKQSDDPVSVGLAWHSRRKVLSEVGTDPAAYREKLKAEILAELQGGQPPQGQPPQGARPMPSNLAGARNVGTRAGPAWSGPQTIDDIFARK